MFLPLLALFPPLSAAYSFGTKKWDGLPLYSSYTMFLGGREVELDNQISEEEMPRIVGASNEPAADLDFDVDGPPRPQPQSFLLQSRSGSSGNDDKGDTDSPASLKKFVSPTSFYGKAPAKPKQSGPLYVVFCALKASPLIFGASCV